MSQKHKARNKREDEVRSEPTKKLAAKKDQPVASDSQKKSKWDDVIDELDKILETDAEAMVRSYRQKGGE